MTLAWIKSSTRRWKTFVIVIIEYWYHVQLSENLASGGLFPDELQSCVLWWADPQWLRRPPDAWPVSSPQISSPEGEERKCVFVIELSSSIVFDLLNRYSVKSLSSTIWTFVVVRIAP